MAHRCVPAPFLTKTYQLVDDPITDDVISWNEIGTTFVVWKSAEFARDLLPNYFKHNNFSSFVRQLNTYGFRKIVPDRWEFMNEFFKKGEKELLCDIHRRKSVHASTAQTTAVGKSNGGGPSSQSNSGDEMGSSSTSSPDTKNNVSDETTATTTTQLCNLSDENEKLRKDNELLNSELAKTKKQCEDLIAFLSKHVNIAPDQINQVIMMQGESGSSGSIHDRFLEIRNTIDDDEKEEKCLKLFGVWLKGKKRERDDGNIGGGPTSKEMKVMDYHAPWMKISSLPGESNKVCN